MHRKPDHLEMRWIVFVMAAALALSSNVPALADQANGRVESWKGKSLDAWVDGKIEASYALSRYLNPFDIDTRVDRGVVHLTGVVESQIDKDLAGEIAEGIDGVKEVRNDLVVEPDAKRKQGDSTVESATQRFSQRFDDATTTARVKFALLANESADGLKINVDTTKGIVSLEGSVSSKQESALAEQIARNAEGVLDVENKLEISNQS